MRLEEREREREREREDDSKTSRLSKTKQKQNERDCGEFLFSAIDFKTRIRIREINEDGCGRGRTQFLVKRLEFFGLGALALFEKFIYRVE